MDLSSVVVILRALLAAVFVVAAVAKLADRPGTERAAAGLGVPADRARAVATVLPVVEIAVAVLLLIPVTAVAGAACAALLLGAFTLGVARALRRGERPSCNCFGQIGAAPISGRTLVRNGVLLAVAVAALVGALGASPATPLAPLSGLTGAEAALVVFGAGLVALSGLAIRFTLLLLRRYGRLLARVERLEQALATAGAGGPAVRGLGDGDPAPAFDLEEVGSRAPVALDELLAPGTHALVVFTDPGCGPCQALAPRLSEVQAAAADHLAVVALSASVPAGPPPVRTLFDEGGQVADAYEAHATPTAVLIRPDGTLAGAPVGGTEAIEELISGYLNQLRAVERMLLGYAGVGETILLFWSPSCGYCDAMLPDVLRWERERGTQAPSLAIVTGSDPEEVREQGIVAAIVHDPELILADFYGAHATPMSVLVGCDGTPRGPAGIGADEVMAMAEAGISR